MLITCEECALQVSDKAYSCPHCGYPMKRQAPKSSKRMRLPNGFGQISRINGRNLRNPYRAMVTVGKDEFGKPVCKLLKPNAYFHTYNEAYQALVEYNKNPYDLSDDITMQELYSRWSERHFKTVGPASIRNFRSSWASCEQIYDLSVRAMKTKHVKECMDSVKDTKRHRVKLVLSMMLDYAVESELIDKNVARIVTDKNINTIESKHHIAYTDEEMLALWSNSDNPIVQMILIQCYTGWRPKELCLLKKTDVNINERYMVGGLKTTSGKDRLVPIHSKILPMVDSLMSSSGEYLFAVHRYERYRELLSKLNTELGLNPEHRPHDPRKHFVTIAKKAKVDEYAIKRIVGHKITDITESIYTERGIDWLLEEIEKV